MFSLLKNFIYCCYFKMGALIQCLVISNIIHKSLLDICLRNTDIDFKVPAIQFFWYLYTKNGLFQISNEN